MRVLQCLIAWTRRCSRALTFESDQIIHKTAFWFPVRGQMQVNVAALRESDALTRNAFRVPKAKTLREKNREALAIEVTYVFGCGSQKSLPVENLMRDLSKQLQCFHAQSPSTDGYLVQLGEATYLCSSHRNYCTERLRQCQRSTIDNGAPHEDEQQEMSWAKEWFRAEFDTLQSSDSTSKSSAVEYPASSVGS